MSFKNLLLAYSGEASFASSLSHAIKLADHHEAWLTAAMRNGRPYFERLGGGLPTALRDQLRTAEQQEVSLVRAKFERAVTESGLAERSEFIFPDQLGPKLPSEFARHYDLIITGFQSDLAGEEHHAVNPDRIALYSGRPVLVVPQDYDAPVLADRVLVAWDGKRSAARALGDAMNAIEGKREVTLLTVGSQAEASLHDGVMKHLERHGVSARHLHKIGSGRNIATIIEDAADEVGARLIVMGAYEHSKFSQDLFGGVTHDVMHTTRVPVFLSH